MNDDQLSRESDLHTFEAIISEIRDPELTHITRMLLLLGVTVYVAGILALTTAGGLGWPGVFGYSATYVPGLLLALRRQQRRFALPSAA
jgi:hypothetical protein